MKSVHPVSSDIEPGIEIIERAYMRINAMIDDLNNMRKESSIQTAEPELINIENILEDVCIALTTQIQDAQIVIKTAIHISEITFSRRTLLERPLQPYQQCYQIQIT